jgi:hypothetical protein
VTDLAHQADSTHQLTRENPMKCTVDTAQFVEMITDALCTAGTDDTLPMLVGVYLHCPDDQDVLVATSTDRYAMAQTSIPRDGALPPLFLDSDSLNAVLDALPTGAHLSVPLEITTTDDDTVTFRQTEADIRTRRQVQITVGRGHVHREGFADKFAELLQPERDADAELDWAAIDPRWLAKVSNVAQGREKPVFITFNGPTKGVVITVGDNYRAVIMPVQRDRQDVPVFPFTTEAKAA